MDISAQIENYKQQIEAAMAETLLVQCPEILTEAMRYSVFAGGKRLRPVLLLASCEAVGGESAEALPFACALEMIHTYSLIHDDLPAMDDDDFRRGRQTNHRVYGEALAILAGDGLLNLAYETMAKACMSHREPKYAAAMAEIAHEAGAFGMIGGQAADVISEDKTVSENTLQYIHRNKTAALIKAAVKAGAMIGGGFAEKVDILEKAGIELGMAFQIKDDMLDKTASKEQLGKSTNSDARNKKATYISVYGMERARKDYEALSQSAIELFQKVDQKFLAEYAKILFKRSM